MKLALTILLSLHGFIHIMGFLKAFNISDIKELKLPITKQWGLAWLLALILCLSSAVLVYIEHSFVSPLTIGTIILSQILAIKFWSDAKFSTIANFLIIGLLLSIIYLS